MHFFDTMTAWVWAALGAFGGVVRVLVQLLNMPQLPPRNKILWLLFANSLVSGFSGFMGAIFMTQFTQNDDLHVVSAGISGYLGVAALDILTDWFRKKVETTTK